PEHPAVRGALDRLSTAIASATGGQIFSFGVTPDTLLVAGVPVEGREAATIGEAAKWLHDRDVLQISFIGGVTADSLQKLLGILPDDSRGVRQRGGPANVWKDEGDPSIAIEQIDFSRVLEDRDVINPIRRKDDLWRSIVKGVLDRRKPTD